MIRLVSIILFLTLAGAALAQFAGTGTGGPIFGRRVDDFIAGQAIGGGSPVTNPCTSFGNQLDFSDTTGCNLVWAGH